MAIDNYLTALRNGQPELAKASGRTYGFHSTELASTGIAGQGTSNILSGYNLDASTSGLTMKVPLTAPGTAAPGHVWEASGALRHGASSRTLMDLEGAQTVSGVKTLDATGGINATAAPDGTGIIIPASSGAPTGANTEGCLVWDATNDILYGGKGGTNWQQLTSTAVLPVSTAAGTLLIGNGSTGWTEETATKVSSLGDITNTATGAADDFTIAMAGAFDASMILSSTGTGADALQLRTSAGGMVVDANSAMTLDAGGALEINSDGGAISIGNDVNAYAVNIGTGGARTITMGSSTTTTAVDIKAGTGGINLHDGIAQLDLNGAGALTETALVSADLTPSGALTLRGGGVSQFGDDTGFFAFGGTGALTTTGITTMDLDCSGTLSLNSSAGVINIGNDAIAQAINIGTGAAARKVTLGNATGATEVEVNTGTAGFDLNALGPVEIDTTGILELNSSGGVIGIGNDANAYAVNIGTGAAARTVTVGSSNTTASTIINSGTVGLDMNSTGPVTLDGTSVSLDGTLASNLTVTGTADLTLSSTLGSAILTSGESAADAVRLNATGVNGGVDIDALLGGVAIDTTAGISLGAAGASDFTVAGAQLQLSTTGSGELDLTSAGLMDMNAGANLDIDVTGTTALTSSTGTTIENTTSGNILLDSQGATSKIIAMLGTDTAATGLEIQNNSAAVLFSIVGTGQADFNYNLDANAGLDVSGGNLTLDSNDLIINTNKFTVDGATGDTLIAGNLTVTGTMFIADTQQVLIEDNNLYLNCTDVTPGAGTGGLTVNYEPTSTSDTVATGGFTAGEPGPDPAAANPKVATLGATTFAVGAFIQITGANNAANKGLFEVLSHTANVLTIRGVGVTACQEDFTQNQFVTDAVVAGVITQVNVSVIRAGTDGMWEVAKGASSPTGSALVFTDLATGGSVTLQGAYEGGNTITTADGKGNIIFTGTEDLSVTLDNIALSPTGAFGLTMAAGQLATILVSDNLNPAFRIREGTTDYFLLGTQNGTETLMIGNVGVGGLTTQVFGGTRAQIRLPNMGLDIYDDAAGHVRLYGDGVRPGKIEGFSTLTATLKDDQASAFKITEGSNAYLDITTSNAAEVMTVGNSGLAALEIYAASPIRFAAANTKGTLYQDKYGTHVVCYVPATKSTTASQGVAFLISGTFEVSGLAADVDQVTPQEMVRGVAQIGVAATNYDKIQISGIAEVVVDGAPAVDEGQLMKWALNGKVCLDSRDLSASAPYYEELAGVVVAAADRAGAPYNPGVQTKVQIMLMNPAQGTYIPA